MVPQNSENQDTGPQKGLTDQRDPNKNVTNKANKGALGNAPLWLHLAPLWHHYGSIWHQKTISQIHLAPLGTFKTPHVFDERELQTRSAKKTHVFEFQRVPKAPKKGPKCSRTAPRGAQVAPVDMPYS